jgi:iron complex transport system substrate-binding protein
METIGGFTSETINLELIVELEPDLILCADGMHESLIPKLDNLGLTSLVLGAESLEGMYDEMELLGKVFDAPAAAEKLSASLKVRVRRVEDVVAEIPESRRPKVFYMVWDDPLMGAGPGSFIGEILTIAGGRNILEDVTEPYPYVSHEAVVGRNPQFIFAPTTHSQEVDPNKIARQPGWEGIDASRLHQIYLLDGDQVSRRGPRMVDALETIAARLYPERFGHDLKDTAPSEKGADE